MARSSEATPKAYRFNPDPAWHAYVASLEPLIDTVVAKYHTTDAALQEDCRQEARIALYTIFPDEVRAKLRTKLTTSWEEFLERYCGRVIRNSVLSVLDSNTKGSWYVGRTRQMKDAQGQMVRVHVVPRYSSLDELVDHYGLEIEEDGEISWSSVSDAGLLGGSSPDE